MARERGERRRLRSSIRPRIVGVVTLALFGASVAFAFVSDKAVPLRDYQYVTAAFADLASLQVGDDIRVKGVRVGQVNELRYVDGQAQLRLQLPPERKLFADATAVVLFRGLLGQKYVDIDPGTPGAGPLPGNHIPIEQTGATPQIDTVLDALDPPTREALAIALRELGGGALGRGEDLNSFVDSSPDLLADLGTTARTLTAEETGTVRLLIAADRLTKRFVGRTRDLEAGLRDGNTTLAALATDDGEPLARTVDRAPEALDALRPALADLSSVSGDAQEALHRLRPGAQVLGQSTPDVRGLLTDGVEPLERIPAVSETGVPAVRALTGASRDLRPVSRQLRAALDDLRPFVADVAPYRDDLGRLARFFADALDDGDAASNWARVFLVADTSGVTGILPIKDPLVCRNPYPEPSEAQRDRAQLTDRLRGC